MKKLLLIVAVVVIMAVGASAQTVHSVALTCTNSPTAGVVYTFYRSTITGGPYSQVSPGTVASCAFTDTAVTAGKTYFYVADAVDLVTLDHSVYSNEAKAVIPPPPAPPGNLTAIAK